MGCRVATRFGGRCSTFSVPWRCSLHSRHRTVGGWSKFRKWQALSQAWPANGGQWKFSNLFILQTQDIFDITWLFDTAWMDSAADRGRQPRQICTLLNSSPSTKISDRTILSQDVRTEQAERKVRVRVFTSYEPPTSLCISNLSELVWALRQQVAEKHSFNLPHMFRTTCLLPVLRYWYSLQMLSCRLGLALRRGLGLLPCMCDQKLLALQVDSAWSNYGISLKFQWSLVCNIFQCTRWV